MSKKNIILIAIVILIFGAAGFIVYKGLFSSKIEEISKASPDFEANQKNIVNMLPYGTNLNLDALESRPEVNKFEYKPVTPPEVGVAPETMIRNIDVSEKSDVDDFTSRLSDTDRLLIQRSTPKK